MKPLEYKNTRPGITQPPVGPCAGGSAKQQQTKQKYKPNHQQTGLPPHSALPIRGKTNKQKLSTNLTKLTQTTGPTLGGQKPKGRKNSTLKAWEKETSNTIS